MESRTSRLKLEFCLYDRKKSATPRWALLCTVGHAKTSWILREWINEPSKELVLQTMGECKRDFEFAEIALFRVFHTYEMQYKGVRDAKYTHGRKRGAVVASTDSTSIDYSGDDIRNTSG